jgi:hypothetical protein
MGWSCGMEMKRKEKRKSQDETPNSKLQTPEKPQIPKTRVGMAAGLP